MRAYVGVLSCLLLMLGVAAAAFALWGATWGALFLVIGIGCLAAIIYGWMTARRIDRELDRISRRGSERQK